MVWCRRWFRGGVILLGSIMAGRSRFRQTSSSLWLSGVKRGGDRGDIGGDYY